MTLTRQQDRFYWREWSMVRRKLREQGLPPAEADARRHAIHVQELGTDKSHLEFTEDDFDAVLAGFWKISFPGDLARQLRQLNMRKTRLLYKIDSLLVRLGKNRRFAEGVLEQIEDGVDPNSVDAYWQRERTRESPRRPSSFRSLDQLDPDELKKVISALRSIGKRSVAGRAVKIQAAAEAMPF